MDAITQATQLLQRIEQRIIDFILECAIARESSLMLTSYFQSDRTEHWLKMKELIRQRSAGQIERMERKMGLRT
jgi:hypothetical protein